MNVQPAVIPNCRVAGIQAVFEAVPRTTVHVSEVDTHRVTVSQTGLFVCGEAAGKRRWHVCVCVIAYADER